MLFELLWLLGLSLALGMDAFAVAMSVAGPFRGQNFRIAFHFGLFQGLFPIAGWLLGRSAAQFIEPWNSYLAFGLLAGIGLHMLWESFGPVDATTLHDRSRRYQLIALSTAVSIDALAVGVAFGLRGIHPWLPCLLIAVVTGGLSLLGLYLGRRLRKHVGLWAERAGAIVLLMLSLKFLLEAG